MNLRSILITLLCACLSQGCLELTKNDLERLLDDAPLTITEATELAFGNIRNAGIIAVQGAPDYSSISLSTLTREGAVASEDFLNSGSVDPLLSTAIGSDVVPAGSPSPTSQIVVIDRGNSVLTWIDSQTLTVDAQMSVGEPFYGHNPNDYLVVGKNKAYVTRYGLVFDDTGALESGDDILIINPNKQKKRGTIALSDQAEPAPNTTATTYARPHRLLMVADYVYVVLQNITGDGSFLAGEAALLVIDPSDDTIVTKLVLSGIENCGSATYSAPSSEVAVVCSGNFAKGPDAQLAASGIVMVDATDPANPSVDRVIQASEFAPKPLANSLGLVGAGKVAVVSFGETDWATGDVLQNENVYVVDTTASTDIASEVYSAAGAFVLNVFADPINQRLYVADGDFAAPVLAVFETDRNTGATTPLADITFANGFPVRHMSVY